MAIQEKDVLLQKKASNGDTQIIYPVTRFSNIIDADMNTLEDFLLDFVSAITTEDGSYLVTEDGYNIVAG